MSYILKYNKKSYTLKTNGKSYLLKVAPKFYEFTINAIPENAVVTINGEVTNSMTLVEGSEVSWSVSLNGYKTQSGSLTLNENTILDVELEVYKYYTLTIVPTPSDATVTINGEVTNSVTVDEGTILNWEVSASGYITQSSSITMVEDVTINVELELQSYTFTINPTPSNATVKLNGQTTKTLTVVYGTTVNWEVSASGYITQSGTVTVTSDSTKNVTLVQAGPLYACYTDVGLYLYAKYPLGSDLTAYTSNKNNLVWSQANTSSELVPAKYWQGNNVVWKSITEGSCSDGTSTYTRYKAGDLYE